MKKVLIEALLLVIIAFLCCLLYLAPRKIDIYGSSYMSNILELDLSNITINVKDLEPKLALFTNLKRVVLKDYSISYDEKYYLIRKYKDISFNVLTNIEVYDTNIREDVEEISFSKIKVDSNLKDYLIKFSNLKKVDLKTHNLSLDEMIELHNTFPNISFLWNIRINNTTYVLSNSKTLDLNNVKIDNYEIFKKSLSLFPNLTYLDMGESNLSNEELADLRVIYPEIKIAWVIHLGKWHLRTDDVAFSVLIYNYNYVRMTSEDIEVLKYCTDLQALDLGHQNITDISVIGKYLKDLRVLILADNKISDISPLKNLKHLHYIELFMNRLEDISPLSECLELVDVNVSFNSRLKDLSPLYDLPKLERIWIVNLYNYRKNQQILQEKHPNAKVSITGPGSTEDGWRRHSRYYAMIDMYKKKNYISEEFSKYDE